MLVIPAFLELAIDRFTEILFYIGEYAKITWLPYEGTYGFTIMFENLNEFLTIKMSGASNSIILH